VSLKLIRKNSESENRGSNLLQIKFSLMIEGKLSCQNSQCMESQSVANSSIISAIILFSINVKVHERQFEDQIHKFELSII
jgi:hypothetical protein